MHLALDQLEPFNQFIGAGSHAAELVSDMLFLGYGGLLQLALNRGHGLATSTSTLDLFLPFATSHVLTPTFTNKHPQKTDCISPSGLGQCSQDSVYTVGPAVSRRFGV